MIRAGPLAIRATAFCRLSTKLLRYISLPSLRCDQLHRLFQGVLEIPENRAKKQSIPDTHSYYGLRGKYITGA